MGGSLFSALFIESGISVGASGALFGLLGGMLSELLTNWTTYDDKVTLCLVEFFKFDHMVAISHSVINIVRINF